MAGTTRLGLYGGPTPPYGPFAGKVVASTVGTEQHTRLGLYGGPRQIYGSFTGKVVASGVGIEQHTRLGLYGGPRMLYGSFAGKVVATGRARGGQFAYNAKMRRWLMREDEEVMIILAAAMAYSTGGRV